MSHRLRHSDLRRLLGVAAELAAVTNRAALPHTLYRETPSLLPADRFTYNECEIDRKGSLLDVRFSIQEPFVIPQALVASFNSLAHEHPCLGYMKRGGPAVRISDYATLRQFRQSGLYHEVFGPVGIERQLMIAFPVGPSRIITVGFNRKGRDFTGEECAALDLLRVHILHAHARTQPPALAACWNNAASLETFRRLGLSAREAEVLVWLVQGKTNLEIGLILKVGLPTVKTHLLHIFNKLGCETRTAAARTAMEAIAQPARPRSDPTRPPRV